jgi:hypothetical protein
VGENVGVTGEIASTPLYPLVLGGANGVDELTEGERGTSKIDDANSSVDDLC